MFNDLDHQQRQEQEHAMREEQERQARLAMLAFKTVQQTEDEELRAKAQERQKQEKIAATQGNSQHTEAEIDFAKHVSKADLGTLPNALYGSSFVSLIEPKDQSRYVG